MTRERLRRVVRTAANGRVDTPHLHADHHADHQVRHHSRRLSPWPAPRLSRRPTAHRPPRLWAAYVLGLAATQAQAAGGHHAVDDAAILDPGQCQVETWTDWRSRNPQGLVHVGPACRIGPVELGLNLERERSDSNGGRILRAGPQLKWAFAIDERLSVGVLATAGWQGTAPRQGRATSLRLASGSVVIPVTWQIDEHWRAHLDVGRDFHRAQPSTSHSGAAIEWSAFSSVSFVAERFREGGSNAWRAGLRWTPVQALSIDLSRARGLRADAPAWWTLGFTWAFAR